LLLVVTPLLLIPGSPSVELMPGIALERIHGRLHREVLRGRLDTQDAIEEVHRHVQHLVAGESARIARRAPRLVLDEHGRTISFSLLHPVVSAAHLGLRGP